MLRSFLARRWRTLVAAALTMTAVYLVLWVYIPSNYLTLGPGPAPDVATLVTPASGSGSDRTGDTGLPGRGRFLLTTVWAASATPIELWKAATRADVELISRAYLVPPGMDDDTYERWSEGAMVESQLTAAWQAFAYLGRPVDLVSGGARVLWVSRESPAAGQLMPGDLVRSWSLGSRTGSYRTADLFQAEVEEAYNTLGPGPEARLALEVERGGRPAPLVVPLTYFDLGSWPFLGVALTPVDLRTEPSVPVEFPPGDIGGPSGGLMLTLQIIDDFTPGDLTQGRVVAGSGTIGPGGRVGAVGGIGYKLRGAVSAGATVFLVPGDDYYEAEQTARAVAPDVSVVRVADLAEAWKALTGASLTAKETPDYNGADLDGPGHDRSLWVLSTRFGGPNEPTP